MFLEKQISATVMLLYAIVGTITYPLVLGLLIRFQRVQVQLRAQEENTIKILETIKRANILEVVFVLTLVVEIICNQVGTYGSEVIGISTKTA